MRKALVAVCALLMGVMRHADVITSARFYEQLYDEAVAHTNGKIGTVHQTATAAAAAPR
jgi:hypothetical protein